MRNSHYYRFTWLMVLLLVMNNCFAAAVPKYNGRMNNAVNKVIKTKLHKKYPFAANDPRFNATINAIGSGVTTLVGGAIVGTTWPALLLATGISAILGYAVPLAVDKGIEWFFKDNGEIEHSLDQNIPSGEVNFNSIPKLGADIFKDPPLYQIMYFSEGRGEVGRYLARPCSKGNWNIYHQSSSARLSGGLIFRIDKNQLGHRWMYQFDTEDKKTLILKDPDFNIKK